MENVVVDPNFPRAEYAANAGLHAAICLPLMSDGRVLAVLEFFYRRARHHDDGLLALYAQVSEHVGLYLQRKNAEAALEQEGRFLQAVLDSIEEGIVACDARGTLTVFNQATRELHGLPERPLPPEKWADHYNVYHPDGTTPMAKEDIPLFRALEGERVRSAEMVVTPKNGDQRLLVASGQPILDSDGAQWGAVVAMHDITDSKRAEIELAHQALHDSLTGLPNRTLLLDRIQHALELSKRLSSTIAVFFLDLDNFKLINDSFGHQAGDRLLEQVASRLESAVRAGDTPARLGGETVARLGGDDFVVLCEDLKTERDAIRIAERLREALATPFTLDGNKLSLTASIGVTFPNGPTTDAESLIRDADVAMYRAKDGGRNRYELFNEEMRSRMLERLRVEHDLRAALERDDLEVHYQPIVAVSDRSVIGVEALVRWRHPKRGLLAPAEFIPLAEETGLIAPIGAWVLEEACRQAVRWDEAHPEWPPMTVSVNVSAPQFTMEFMQTVSTALRETGLDPKRLILEITERIFVEHPESAELIRALRQQGIRLALDDFGTGYSSLGYLTKFPLDILKIDRSLVAGLDASEQACRVTAAAIEMGRAVGMSVVGEGVETAEQLERLRDLGCHFAQGYFFGRPESAETTGEFLTECFDRQPVLAEADGRAVATQG